MPAVNTEWTHFIKIIYYYETKFKRNQKILDRKKTALLIIDIQERILGVMQNPDRVVSNTIKLIKGFKILNSPIFYTEQYPKGLGSTFPEIKIELGEFNRDSKNEFQLFWSRKFISRN